MKEERERDREREEFTFFLFINITFTRITTVESSSQRRMQKCPRFSSQKETALVKSEQFSRELKIFSQRKNTFFYRIFEIHFKSFEFL